MKCKSCHREMTIVRLPKYPGAYGVVVLVIGMGVSIFLALKRPEMWYLSAVFGALCLVVGAFFARAKGELVLCTSCGGRDALDENQEKLAEQEAKEKQTAELRLAIEHELKPAIESAAKARLQREMEGAAGAEMRARLEKELKGELEDRIRQNLGAQLRAEIEGELRPAIEAQLKPAVEAQLTPQIEARLRTEIEAQLRPAIERDVRADVERMLQQQRAAAPLPVEPAAFPPPKPEPKPEPVRLAPEPVKPEPAPEPRPVVARIEPVRLPPPKPEPKPEPVRVEPVKAEPEPIMPAPEPIKLEVPKIEPPKAPPKVEPAPARVPVVAVTEPHKKAARKARVIVSDVLLYDRPLVEQAARAADPYAALDRVWAEAQRTYTESVAAEVRKDTDYLREAFEDMFKKIRKELKLE